MISLVFFIIATILAFLAAFNVASPRFNLLAAAVGFTALAFAVGGIPALR